MKRLAALFLLVLICSGRQARADAIVVTQAMKASTIAEVFITDDSVHVELEVGLADLAAFRNALPDAIYERITQESTPLAERLPVFHREDWVIKVDGSPLPGRITRMGPGERVRRDPVTGDPLPMGENEESELVVFIEIGYALPGHPQTLSIRPPRGNGGLVGASIGFVAYHMGLPVSDFRYLGAEETLEFDWVDPWYSRFRNRNLKRRYDAPLSVFLYVDNFEVRKEIIVRPKDAQQWVDLGIADQDTIFIADQEEIKRRVAEFFSDKSPVTIDGRTPEPVLDRIHFVRRTLRRTGVVDPPEDLPVVSATLGVIYVYPIDSLPESVSMPWEFFSERFPIVPAAATDEAGGLPYFLAPGDSILVWQNFLKNPTIPGLIDIDAPRAGSVPVSVLSLAGVLLLVPVVVRFARVPSSRKSSIVAAVVLVTAAALLSPFARVALPLPFATGSGVSDAGASSVVGGLLTNVYRAFDFRDESDIYDALARSASGDLLSEIYLETRKALELQSQGGALVKVKEVEMMSVDAEPLGGEAGFSAQCEWNVSGSVGHWGHIHTRTNQYSAVLTIKPVDGVWKITDLELLEEQRIL